LTGAVRRAAALALAAALAGCAGSPGGASSATGPSTASGDRAPRLPDAVWLRDVPFVAQPEWQCGPAALSIAMAAAGRPVPVRVLADSAFVPGLQGTLQAEMLAATRRQGMLATVLPASFDALRRELAAGRPVVVLQNLGLAAWPKWHYAVLVGYDDRAAEVRLHSGDEPSMAMGRRTFERTWARGDRWAIAVTPPSVLPESADEASAIRAAIGLERTDTTAASRAWEAVIARWPRSAMARFGRANLRFAGGDARSAVDDYRAAVAIDPGFADAWNNLAQALAALGEPAAASEAADRAVALGGPRAAAYRDTRASIGR
jgi:hypothetical protein